MTIRPSFDTARYLTTLTAAGMGEGLAAAQVEALSNALAEASDGYATQSAMERMETRLLHAIERLTLKVEENQKLNVAEFNQLRLGIKNANSELEAELSEKIRVQGFAMLGAFTAIMALLVGASTALIKLFP